MSDMKCPFCNQELEQITTSNPLGLGRIEMAVCKKCMDKGVLHIMPIWDWQELIRAHKALDVALCSLQDIAESDGDFITGASTPLDEHEYADMMLKEIKRQMKIKTALEQKD